MRARGKNEIIFKERGGRGRSDLESDRQDAVGKEKIRKDGTTLNGIALTMWSDAQPQTITSGANFDCLSLTFVCLSLCTSHTGQHVMDYSCHVFRYVAFATASCPGKILLDHQ